jgi:hypothetical protein
MKKTILFICLGLIMTTFNSCKKEGCMDIDAGNYSSEVKKDDGSCVYSEKLIIWQDLAASQYLTSVGITGLSFYVNGQLIGTCLATNYWTGTPSCEQTGIASTTIDLGKITTSTVNLEVKDQTGVSLWTDLVTITAGSCATYQL